MANHNDVILGNDAINCNLGCMKEPAYIKLFKGYGTYFNGKHLIHIGIQGVYSEQPRTYKFILGSIVKTFQDITTGFFVDITASETGSLNLGPLNGSLIAVDGSGNETPLTTAIPFIIENWVQGDIEVEQVDITINVKNGDTNDYVINLKSPYFDQVEHNDLLKRDANNCHPIKSITGLQDSLDNKQDVIQDIELIRSGAEKGLTALQKEDISTGESNGTISVKGTDIPVKGLGSAAFTESSSYDRAGSASVAEQNAKNYADGLSSNYATAEQGEKADTALQPSDITTGSSNGTVSVNGSDVPVKGLGSAAYTSSSDYATSTQGGKADTALQPSDVINNTSSNETQKPLSANMGKSLQEQVNNLKQRGHFLSLWNCATGLAQSNPPQSPYTYQAGDFFIVGTTATGSGTNYKPTGSSYTTGVASTVVETEAVDENDVYWYDGTQWLLQINTQKEVSFGSVAGDPYDNTNLAAALNDKQDSLVSGTNIKTVNNNSLLGSGNIDIDALPSQSGQSGKYLTTNGTTASWGTIAIPTVNNSTITLTQGGVTKGSFTLNQSSAQTIALDAGGGSDATLEDIAEAGTNITFTSNVYTNYTVVGSPTISSDYVLSNISGGNYIYATSPISSGTNFEIVFKVRTPATIPSSDYPVFTFSTGSVGSEKDVFLEGSTKKFCQWDGSHKVSGTSTIQPDTDYIVKLTYDGSNYKLYVNEILEYTTSYAIASSGNIYVGIFGSDQFWIGSVYLKDCYIKSNDEYLWRACTPFGKTTINSDIEGFTAAEVNTIWESVV